MIRLRQSLEGGLRHPVLGPLVLLLLGLILAFVVFHAMEHGIEGLLFSCAIAAAVSLRLVAVLGRARRPASDQLAILGRAPPRRRANRSPAGRTPAVRLGVPLRL